MKYPMKLQGVCKDYLWGGKKLKQCYSKKSESENIAESWELCCHPDGKSIILNGAYKNKYLSDYLASSDINALGTCVSDNQFPLLTKLIDTIYNLSIQVHPDDVYAMKNENQLGKTEFWYVIDSQPGASLSYGFSKQIGKNEFIKRAKEGTITKVLNSVTVKPGDVFLIKPGTVHAIGKNMTIAEIGTNCNITYRIYDYNRKDADGHSRPLHIEQSSDAVQFGLPYNYSFDENNRIDCGTFVVEKKTVQCNETFSTANETFHHILCVDGNGLIRSSDCDDVEICKGSSVFIPAGMGTYHVLGKCDLLITTCKHK